MPGKDIENIPGNWVNDRHISIITVSIVLFCNVRRSTSDWNALISGNAALRIV